MAYDIIKSVRVRAVNASIDERSNGVGDIEVRVVHDRGKKYEVWWIPAGGTANVLHFKKSGKYSLYSADNFIHARLYQQSKLIKNENASIVDVTNYIQDYYEIIQDPYDKDNVPRFRSFGGDPYYLNNKTKITISWISGGLTNGGVVWSDEFGNELSVIEGLGEFGGSYDKSPISKYVFISNEESGEKFVLDENMTEFISDVKSPSDIYTWGNPILSTVYDETILEKIIEIWNKKVVDYYELGVCYNDINKPSPFSCNEVEYRSPLEIEAPEEEPEPTEETFEINKIKLSIVLPEGLELKVKEDLDGLKVYIGDPPPPGGFVFQDDFNQGDLDGEFTEVSFIGSEEIPYKGPDPLAREDTYDSNGDKSPDGDVVFDVPSSGKLSDKQKTFIKNATKATGVGPGGLCARYTYNHANNYTLQIVGKTPKTKGVPAGGNANQESYHKNLERLGYKRFSQGTVTKAKLNSELRKSTWDIGDVVVYWATGGVNDGGASTYGHTQIYSAGHHGQKGSSSKYAWVSDEPNNFKCGFVYNSKKGKSYENWRFIIFKAPKPKSESIA